MDIDIDKDIDKDIDTVSGSSLFRVELPDRFFFGKSPVFSLNSFSLQSLQKECNCAVDKQKRHNQIHRPGMSGKKFAECGAEKCPHKGAGCAD